jgi:hypothetical protein
MPDLLTDRHAIKDYIENLYGHESDGNLVIFEAGADGHRRRHHVFPYRDREIAFDFLAAQPQNVHYYVAVALHDEQAYVASTRRTDTASMLPFLALDIDLAGGVHAASNLPNDAEQALRLLDETGLPKPTTIIHSGGGLYPIWQFEQPFLMSSSEDRSRVTGLWRAWNQRAKAIWDRQGLKLDTIADLARVLRVPGSFNPKTEPPRPVKMLPGGTGVLWNIERLEEVVTVDLATSPSQGRRQTLADILREEELSADNKPARDSARGAISMVTACHFLSNCDQNAEQLAEPDWKDAADLLVHIPEGRRYFHRLSARDPRYTHQETEAKLDYASKFPPKLCETIASRHTECTDCLFRNGGVIRTPISLAWSEPGLVALQTKYVLDTKTGLFFDTSTGRAKSKDDFDRSFTRNIDKRQLASTAFRNSKISCITDEHDFLVGNERLIVNNNGYRVLNTWKNGGVLAAEGDASIWLDHLTYLLPAHKERKWILQYLAHLIQRPAVKIKSAIVLQSQQGVGKNLLVQSIKRMFHENDVRELYGGILGERWQAELGNARLIALDELQIDELKAAYNRLKRWATEETQSVERKGIDAFTVRTPRGMIIMTNSHKPMAIEHDDRRLFVCKVDAPKRDRDYYRTLVEVGLADTSVAAFKHFLLNFDLSDFDANAEPPSTGAKNELIRASASLPEQIIMELRENGSGPFNRPVYLAEDVARSVEERLRRPITAQQITPILKQLGDRRRDGKTVIPRPVGKTPRAYVWVWQDVDQWMTASNDQIRAAFLHRGDLDEEMEGSQPFPVLHGQLANCPAGQVMRS